MAKYIIEKIAIKPCNKRAILEELKQQYPPQDIFIIEEIINFIWQIVLHNTYIKTDILNKQNRGANNATA